MLRQRPVSSVKGSVRGLGALGPLGVSLLGMSQMSYISSCAIKVPSSSTREHIPTSQSSDSSPSCIPTPRDELHSILYSWIKNMNKLSSLIDCLQELISTTPADHWSELLRQVVASRAAPKKQQEQFMEFLQMSKEYANGYLLDISAEIQQHNTLSEKLKGRLEAVNKLCGEAVNLQMLYESGTVAAMHDLRATGKAASCRLQRQELRL